jgi:phytoene dehydrogenase-like protein
VEFRFSAPVTEVLLADGRAAGVVAGGERIEGDLVLCAADPRTLVPGPDRPLPRVRRLSVLLAARGGRPEGTAHRTVVHTADRERELAALFDARTLPDRPTIQVLRPDDDSLVPDTAHEAVTLTVTIPDADEVPDSYAEHLLDHLAASGLDLADRALWRELRVSAPFPAPSLAGASGSLLSLANQSAVPGLVLIGEHAHPGGGLARAGMSASITAGVIGPA